LSTSATWRKSQNDQADLAAGSDLRVTGKTGITTLSALGQAGTYAGLPGVATISPAYRLSGTVGSRTAEILALDATKLAHLVTLRPDLEPEGGLAGAAAAQVQAIDTVYIDFKNEAGLRRECEEARRDGFTGKMAIHPGQVAVINEVFTPTQEQFDHAIDLLEAYEKATTEGGAGERKGAVMFGDEMIDEASRKMALKFVTRGERAGMTRS